MLHRFRLIAATGFFLATTPAHALPKIDLPPLDAVPLRLTATQLVKPQPALKVDLPGRSITFATKTLSPQAGMTGVRGNAGEENRLHAFLWNGRILSADVYADDGRYQLISYLGRNYWVRDVDIVRPPLTIDDTFDALSPLVRTSQVRIPAAVAAPGLDGKYRIDLQLLYTAVYQQRTAASAAAIRAEAQRLIFLANTYFENSRIPVQYRLVGTVAPYSAATEDTDCYGNVGILANDPYIRSLRDTTGADVVVLLRTSDNDGTGGIGTGFNQAEQSQPPANVDPERDGYACIPAAPNAVGSDAQTLDVDHRFAHELGHVLGGGHQYKGPKNLPLGSFYWRPYAHAWRCGGIATEDGGAPLYGPGVYHTLMAANNVYAGGTVCVSEGSGCVEYPTIGPLEGYPKGDFFSSPRQKRGNTRCGADIVQPPLGEALQADNARSITEAAAYVAAYRGTVVP
jgi:hypothetical protein